MVKRKGGIDDRSKQIYSFTQNQTPPATSETPSCCHVMHLCQGSHDSDYYYYFLNTFGECLDRRERVPNEKSPSAFSEKGAAGLRWLSPEKDLTRLRVYPGGEKEVWSELELFGGGCVSSHDSDHRSSVAHTPRAFSGGVKDDPAWAIIQDYSSYVYRSFYPHFTRDLKHQPLPKLLSQRVKRCAWSILSPSF